MNLKNIQMKKLTALICATAMLSLTGCGAAKGQSSSGMEIKPIELTKSEQELLDFVDAGDDIQLLTYNMNDEVNSIHVEILSLNDSGQWESQGGSMSSSTDLTAFKEKTGQLMIALREDGTIKLSEQHEGGTTTWTSEAVSPSLVGEGGKFKNKLGDPTAIVLGEPVPVVIFGRTTKNEFRTYSLSDYKDVALWQDYEDLSVITVCFSGDKLE